MVLPFPPKKSYFNSPEPNLASPLTQKSIETLKSYKIPLKVPNPQTHKFLKCKK